MRCVSVAAQAQLSSRQRGFLLGRGYLVAGPDPVLRRHTEAGLTTSPARIAASWPLVHGYASGLGNPLTDAEHQAFALGHRPAAAVGHRRLGRDAR
jgi:hypothetical protein